MYGEYDVAKKNFEEKKEKEIVALRAFNSI